MALKKYSLRAAAPQRNNVIVQSPETSNGTNDASSYPPGYGDSNRDAEKLERTASGGIIGAPRGMSRVDGVRKGSFVGEADASGEVNVGIGKQMEMEAGNAIQYRTCSWYKVYTPSLLGPSDPYTPEARTKSLRTAIGVPRQNPLIRPAHGD